MMHTDFARRGWRAWALAASAATLGACGGGSSQGTANPTDATRLVAAQAAVAMPADAVGGAATANASVAAAPVTRERAQAVANGATLKVGILAYTRWNVPAYQDHIARFGLAVLGMPESTTPEAITAVVNDLKVRNPGLLIGQASTLNDVPATGSPASTALDAGNWWLRTASGNRTSWTGQFTDFDVNLTAWVPADASGMRWPRWKGEYDAGKYFAARPGLSFVFSDLVWPQAVDADWRRIGSNQPWSDGTVQAATRAGYVSYWDALRVSRPDLKVVANVSPTWWGSAEFAGKLNGAFLNSMIGRSWSVETTSGWAAAMQRYRSALAAAAAPKMVIFHAAAASTDFRTMRYALASALLDDGWFALSATDGVESSPWMDEFSAPLGAPAAGPTTAADPSGLWVRDYANGKVLVNPSPSASITINLGGGYRRLAGRQDPITNNGAAVSTVTLAPRDGLVLLKVPAAAPAADTQAPTAPASLTRGELTCNLVMFSWTAATDNVGVTHYDIYHDGQFYTHQLSTHLYTWVRVPPGATWNLYVNARDAAGNVSQASPTLQVKVPQCTTDTQAPTTPTGLTGSVNGTSATLRWTAATDNVGVTAYDIWRNGTKVGSTASLSFTDSGLAPNAAYSYAVSARDAQSNNSARSVSVSLTTGSACAAAVCSVAQVATDVEIPWGLVSLADGTIIYSRRDSHDILRLNPATGAKTTLIAKVPDAQSTGAEGGLLGLAALPGFPTADPWLYIYHSTATDNRVVRMKLVNGVLDTTKRQVLVSGIARNIYHNGGRLRFGPDGKLYVATGDGQAGNYAQDLNRLHGKILRVNPDGSVPADNPFGTLVWSYGHRNPQGLAFDSKGQLWQQEFGNTDMDETNLIVKGGNYGWPNCEGTVSKAGTGCGTAGYIAPKATYLPAEASCSGLAVVRDTLYVACLRGQRLLRWSISGSSLVSRQDLFVGTYGRLRTVEPTIDGGLWLTTTNNNDADRIFKVNLGQ